MALYTKTTLVSVLRSISLFQPQTGQRSRKTDPKRVVELLVYEGAAER